MTRALRTALVAAVAVCTLAATVRAQDGGLDPEAVALAYHRLTGEALDLERIAQSSDAVRRASNFDRPDVLAREVAQLENRLAAADPNLEFTTRVNDNISEYDHDRGQFSVVLFTPGYYVPVQAFGQQYRLVFANAEQARTIPMLKEDAREFDARLNRSYRQVTTEVHFRITGSGDPAGGVTGPRVVRAEMSSVRVLDRAGNILHAPDLSAAPAALAAAPFDAAGADVAGFRVGVKATDLEATLTRLFGAVTRRAPSAGAFGGVTTVLAMNEMGCSSFTGNRATAEPGAVCVTAYLDDDDMVRVVRIERLFAPFQGEAFRAALTEKYGPVADARSGSVYALGWGDPIDPALLFDRSVPHRALTASYQQHSDFLSRGLNAIPDIKVVLQLVDAAWAARAAR